MMNFPLRMKYAEPYEKTKEVDVYNITCIPSESGIITIATFWVIEDKLWITAPMHSLTPINKKGKQLNE